MKPKRSQNRRSCSNQVPRCGPRVSSKAQITASSNSRVGQQTKSDFDTTMTQTRGIANSMSLPVFAQKTGAHICFGCSKPIKKDKYLLKACDKYWHENCLRCDRCHTRLGELGSTLYCKSNMNLCRHDYLEMFGETGICSVCEKLICASEMVMRARQNVYHLECFACQLCNQRFCVGDRFYLCENKVVCQYDYEEHILPIKRSFLQESNCAIADKEDGDDLMGSHDGVIFGAADTNELENLVSRPTNMEDVKGHSHLPQTQHEQTESLSNECTVDEREGLDMIEGSEKDKMDGEKSEECVVDDVDGSHD